MGNNNASEFEDEVATKKSLVADISEDGMLQ
jgi:hypothetical protein